jgi:hypothetical protein
MIAVVAAVAGVAALGVTAAQGALPLPLNLSTNTTVAATADPPVPPGEPTSDELLCGTVAPPGNSATHGKSPIDHPTWDAVSGMEYPYTGTENCDSPPSSNGTFTWSIKHSNVNTLATSERGTEHGVFMDTANGMRVAGFNGQVTNWDFGSGGDSCGPRVVYYASGHNHYANCGPSGQGNFNTHGGQADMQHFRGTYGTVVYQNDDNNSCLPGQAVTYCFEAILNRGH